MYQRAFFVLGLMFVVVDTTSVCLWSLSVGLSVLRQGCCVTLPLRAGAWRALRSVGGGRVHAG